MSATGSESVLVWSQLWKMEAVRRPAASDQGLCIAQSEEAQVRSTFHAPALALFVIHFLVNAKPILAPAAVPAPAPAPAPACPPKPQPGCARSEHVCGAQRQYRISDAQFTALNAAHTCAADLDVSFCIVGRYIVEALVFDAVKGGNCTRECLQGVSLPTCSAAAVPDLAPAPAPSFSLYGAPAPLPATADRIAQLSTRSASSSEGGASPRYEVQTGPLGECSATCGGGQAQRSLSCFDAVLGLPVELSMCQLDPSSLHNLTQSCNTQPCGSCHWAVGEWGGCSAACGMGTATRSVQCMSGGQPVAAYSAQCGGACAAATAPTASRPCAAAASCAAVMWQAGPWSACQSGSATRSVACIDAHGNDADSKECTRLLGDAPEAPGFAGPTCSISLGPCAIGNSSALAGPLNASMPLCCATGVVDKQGTCCSSGVVSDGGFCCAAAAGKSATLDRSGQCCADGRLDACGLCGGNATAVDFTGACCAGSLDAGGRCCPAPAVTDEFGVCGGTSSSGLVVLNLATTTNSTQGLGNSNSPGYAVFSEGLVTDLSARLGVNTSQISVKAVSLPGTASRRLLSSEVTPVIDGVIQAAGMSHSSRSLYNPDFAFMAVLGAAGSLAHAINHPSSHLAHGRALAQDSSTAAAADASVWVIPPYGSLSYAQLLQLLGNSSAADASAAVRLTGISSFSKSGLAGNGLCELGELPTADSAGVPSDCPLGYHAVPSGANGTACSGRGLPVAAQGVCQCFVGYEGPACGGCADGYWPGGGLCQRTIGSFQAEAALAGRNALLIPATAPAPAPATAAKNAAASLAAPLIASLLGAFLLVALVSIIWVIVSRRRKRRAAEPAEKTPAVEGTKGSLQDLEKGHNAASSSQVGGAEARLGPQSHAISLVSDSSTVNAATPIQTARGSFFGLFGRPSQQADMQPAASPASNLSSSGSVSSMTSARRRSHAMGSITFASPCDSRTAPINTSRRSTFSYVHGTEAGGPVHSHPLRQSSSPRSLHSADSQTPFPTHVSPADASLVISQYCLASLTLHRS
ncbi:hypothetical protein WJX75_000310 [Coccomyxa subellipsoidea]|uniref:EGF-like domain-containing protein n=1 Tax=Coccomyxa subellipsoidea TaxID=248742 RepID=A0ABR2YQI3_9CHLO